MIFTIIVSIDLHKLRYLSSQAIPFPSTSTIRSFMLFFLLDNVAIKLFGNFSIFSYWVFASFTKRLLLIKLSFIARRLVCIVFFHVLKNTKSHLFISNLYSSFSIYSDISLNVKLSTNPFKSTNWSSMSSVLSLISFRWFSTYILFQLLAKLEISVVDRESKVCISYTKTLSKLSSICCVKSHNLFKLFFILQSSKLLINFIFISRLSLVLSILSNIPSYKILDGDWGSSKTKKLLPFTSILVDALFLTLESSVL